MKMIGMSARSTATRCCRSRPLRPGMLTSSTRQLGATARGRARNSCADANVSARQPAQRISNSSDSRTEISSSTTNTVGMASVISGGPRFAGPSAHSKCVIDRLKQSRLAERLEQTCHGSLCEQALTDGLISVGSDEDGRNMLAATRQFSLEIGSRHSPGHQDVENQALGLED